MSSYTDCTDKAVMMLAKVFSTARHVGDIGDLEKLLDALRILRADWVQWDVYEAWLHIRRYEWMEALHFLQQADSRRSLPVCTALLGCCLYAIKDATWESYALQALEQKEDPEATRIATELIKYAEKRYEANMASAY